ncbi:MAG: type II secretion system F family protein [archaeon]
MKKAKKISKEPPKEKAKEILKGALKEMPKEKSKEILKRVLKEMPKEASKEILKEASKEMPKVKNAEKTKNRYKKFSRMLPTKWGVSASKLLVYAGLSGSGSIWVAKRIILAIVMAIALPLALFMLGYLPMFYALIAVPIVFVSIFGGSFTMLSLKVNKRAIEIEKILPSALQLIAANIRAGMTPDRAIWMSAREEFGEFAKEIKKVGSESLGGTPLTEAFLIMSEHVRSPILGRTVRLIVEGMESGGELAKLLDETAEEIQSLLILEKEMATNTSMYTMFVAFASLGGAPLLLGISTFFVEMITKMTEAIGFGDMSTDASASGMGLMGFTSSIGPDFLFYFALTAIIIITFFASLLYGLIKNGDEKKGLQYAPIFVICGVTIFFLVRYFITQMFGSMMVM